MSKTLLIYPPLGADDIFIKDIPLSLLYLAADSLKSGHDIDILDLRLYDDWKSEIRHVMTPDTKLVGLSVMTGNPIKNSMKISRFIKENYRCMIIWGGHHPTMEYESTMEFEAIDFIIRGFGSAPLNALLNEMDKDMPEYDNVPALSYRKNGKTIHNPVDKGMEIIHYKDIPYHLVEGNINKYMRFGNNERIIPIFTSIGCPYKCSFCMAPALYKDKEKKWEPFDTDEVIEHIRFLVDRYKATYLSVYDDDSFVNIPRMKVILERIVEEGIKLTIDFRGARINELDRMSDEDFALMERAGVKHFQVGLESGSQKVLDIMNKKIDYEQIIRVNKRLARFSLFPIYNLMAGVPGETIDDLRQTRDIVLRLYKENKNCITGHPAKFKPLPGTVLYETAIQNGLKPMKRLEDWIELDSGETDIYMPWYTKRYDDYIKMFQITSFFVDNKILREIPPTTIFNRILRFIAVIYRPIAILRLKYDITTFNIEFIIYRIFRKLGASQE